MDILVFQLDGLRCGFPLNSVREIVRAVAITPLPTAPAVVEGVIDVRGAVVPVFGLRERLGLPIKRLSPADHLVLAWVPPRLVAFRVDRADWMASVPDHQIEDAKGLVASADHIAGVAKLPDGLVLIHDPRTFLDAAESATLEAALEASRPTAAMGASTGSSDGYA